MGWVILLGGPGMGKSSINTVVLCWEKLGFVVLRFCEFGWDYVRLDWLVLS